MPRRSVANTQIAPKVSSVSIDVGAISADVAEVAIGSQIAADVQAVPKQIGAVAKDVKAVPKQIGAIAAEIRSVPTKVEPVRPNVAPIGTNVG